MLKVTLQLFLVEFQGFLLGSLGGVGHIALMGLVHSKDRTDGTHHKVKSELAADYIPEVDDFTVEVFKQEGSKDKRLYRDTYPNSKDKAIKLNAGSYYMLAYHGNFQQDEGPDCSS